MLTNFGVRAKLIRMFAPVVELADTMDLGSIAAKCAGSSPVGSTMKKSLLSQKTKEIFSTKFAYGK